MSLIGGANGTTVDWLLFTNIQKIQFIVKKSKQKEDELGHSAQTALNISLYLQPDDTLCFRATTKESPTTTQDNTLFAGKQPFIPGMFECDIILIKEASNKLNLPCPSYMFHDGTFMISLRYNPEAGAFKSLACSDEDLQSRYYHPTEEENKVVSLDCNFCQQSLWQAADSHKTDESFLPYLNLFELPSKSWHELVDAWSCHQHEFSDKFKPLITAQTLHSNFILPSKRNQLFVSLDKCFAFTDLIRKFENDLELKEPSKESCVTCKNCQNQLGNYLNDGSYVCLDLFAISWQFNHSFSYNMKIDYFEMALVRQITYYIQYDCMYSFRLQTIHENSFDFWISHARLLHSSEYISDSSSKHVLRPVLLASFGSPTLQSLVANGGEQSEQQILFIEQPSIFDHFISLFQKRILLSNQFILYL